MNAEDNPVSRPEVPARGAGDAARAWQLLALAAAAYLLLGLLGESERWVAAVPAWLALAIALAAGGAFVAIAVAMVALICRLPLTWMAQLGLAAAFGAACAAARIAHISLLGDLLLVVAATFVGALVSRVVRESNMLVPVVVAAAVVDTWGVYWGFVAEMSKRAPQVVKHFSATVPAATAVETPVPLLGAVGIGDFLFMGLFVAAVYRLHMSARATLWALFVALLAVPVVFGLADILAGGPVVPALPGLPFLGLGVVVANWGHFRFSRAEKFALLYAAVAVGGVIGLAWAVKHALGG